MEIKTKYNIGDRVWVVYEPVHYNDNKKIIPLGEVSVYDAQIDSISIDKDGFMYYLNDGEYTEIQERDVILYDEKDKLLEKIEQIMQSIHDREKKKEK